MKFCRRLAEASRRRALEREASMRLQEETRIKELQRELERIEKEEKEPSPKNSKGRRPSRFAISSVDDANLGPTPETDNSLLTPSWGSRKLKGILKKNEDWSHTVHGAPETSASPFASPYTTVTGTG